MNAPLTYAEIKGQPPFDWTAFLTAALKTPPTEEQWEEARERSKDWVTCACGNLCSILPRENDGRPQNDLLTKLGGSEGFYDAIRAKNASLALHYLSLIELHSAYLIRIEEAKAVAARALAATAESAAHSTRLAVAAKLSS